MCRKILLKAVFPAGLLLFFAKNTVIAQTKAEKEAIRYIDKMERHPGFSKTYRKLMYKLKDLSSKDSLLATAVIRRLDSNRLFNRLLKVRLDWDFKERLNENWLNQCEVFSISKGDSAMYFYTLALYKKDSLLARFAKNFGYVKLDKHNPEIEIPDWKKIYSFRWNSPKVLEGIICGLSSEFNRPPIYLSSIYFQKAADTAPSEPFFLEEWMQLVANAAPYEEVNTIIQTLLRQRINAFTPVQQRKLLRLAKRLTRNLSPVGVNDQL